MIYITRVSFCVHEHNQVTLSPLRVFFFFILSALWFHNIESHLCGCSPPLSISYMPFGVNDFPTLCLILYLSKTVQIHQCGAEVCVQSCSARIQCINLRSWSRIWLLMSVMQYISICLFKHWFVIKSNFMTIQTHLGKPSLTNNALTHPCPHGMLQGSEITLKQLCVEKSHIWKWNF